MKLLHPLVNNRGYALILTLAAITIFSVLGITFMTHALNTTKQTHVIEEKVQAIDMAELGVEFYNHKIDEELEEIKNKMNEEGNVDLDIEKLVKKVINDHDFDLNKKEMYSKEKEMSFNIAENSFIYDDVEKKIQYKVKGNVEDREAIIHAQLYLDFDTITVESGEENPGENKSWLDKVNIDDKFVKCDSVFDPNYQCVKQLNNAKMKDDNYFKLIVEESASINNMMNANNFVLYINGSTNINNMKNANNFELYINNNATIQNMKDTYKFKLFINGNATFQNIKDAKNYELFVAGEANINSNTSGATNAKICVNHLTNYLGGNAEIYAMKNSTNHFIANSKSKPDDVNLNEFKENCWDPNGNNGEPSNITWHNPIYKREYIYE